MLNATFNNPCKFFVFVVFQVRCDNRSTNIFTRVDYFFDSNKIKKYSAIVQKKTPKWHDINILCSIKKLQHKFMYSLLNHVIIFLFLKYKIIYDLLPMGVIHAENMLLITLPKVQIKWFENGTVDIIKTTHLGTP